MSSILASLNPQQQKAGKHFDGPALVVAGPGSGKTRVLTHRVAFLVKDKKIDPQNILCVTFTNKAAGEMRERIFNLLKESTRIESIGTFHSMCARILRRDGIKIGIPHNFVIFDHNDSKEVIRKVMKRLNISSKRANPSAVLARISQAKNELIDEVEFGKYTYGMFLEKVSQIYPEYQKFLRKSKALDFDDLLSKAVNLFIQSPQTLKKYQEKFKYILVDEYQDTNHAQYMFIKLLAEKYRNVFVVGDMSQSIYAFRGADFKNILNFQRDYKDAKIYRLEQNYRSQKSILDAATNVISNNKTHIVLDLWTKQKEETPIKLFQAWDEKDEARYVVDAIKKEEGSFENFAVLYRTNAQSRGFEEAFLKSGIPYKLVGGTRFYERKEIKDVLSYLRLLNNPEDEISKDRIEKLGKGRKGKFNDFSRTANVDKSSTLELLDGVLEATGYLQYLDNGTEEGETRIENVKELRTVASEFGSLSDFLENISLVEGSATSKKKEELFLPNNNFEDSGKYVTLMTFHRAKGLEFENVFMVGMEEGLFPHSRSLMDPLELEEERRLCYVGITRTMKDLHLTFTRKRLYFGTLGQSIMSRFIEEIPEHLIEKIGGGKILRSEKRFRSNEDFLDSLEIGRGYF